MVLVLPCVPHTELCFSGTRVGYGMEEERGGKVSLLACMFPGLGRFVKRLFSCRVHARTRARVRTHTHTHTHPRSGFLTTQVSLLAGVVYGSQPGNAAVHTLLGSPPCLGGS